MLFLRKSSNALLVLCILSLLCLASCKDSLSDFHGGSEEELVGHLSESDDYEVADHFDISKFVYIFDNLTDSEKQSLSENKAANSKPTFVLNTSSRVIHLSGCGSVKSVKEKNKLYTEKYDEYLEKGYKLCGSCFKDM